jgi:hypothetical protein
MANDWYYTQNGQPAQAPVSAAQLKQLAAAGQLQPTDLVWQEGMANWAPASSIKGLFGGPIKEAPSPAAPTNAEKLAPRGKVKAGPTETVNAPLGGGLMDMHPLLVLLLSVCTFGIFGLVYAFKVCFEYAALASRRETDSAGRVLGRARHPLWVLLLTYLTAGYYFYYWVYAVMRECSDYTGRKDFNARTEFSLMLLFPPYAIYVAVFKLPDMIRRAQGLAGIPESGMMGTVAVFLNPCMVCGLPFLGMLYQDALNHIWFSAP